MLDWQDIVLRLGAATLAGAAIGLNRDLHSKPIGLRTLGLVGLAASMIVVLAESSGTPDTRLIQGILTGVGFLGAGVIIHADQNSRIRGLTSAACTWLTACIGIMCGAGQWKIVTVGLVITFIVLIAGGRAEASLHRALGGKDYAAEDPAKPISPADTSPT
jgi:putative Mg2+ transporter-C (MgtC) family protein